MPEQPLTSDLVSYRIAVRTATVAAIFSLVVAALMAYDYARRSMKDPFTVKDPTQTSARDALKAAIKQEPESKPIQEAIRTLDQEARDEYFRERAFTYSGAVLLCGGILVALAAGRWAGALRRKHPQLLPAATQRDWEANWTPAARWTVGGLFVVLVTAAGALSLPLGAAPALKPVGPVAVAGEEKAAGKETQEKTVKEEAAAKGQAAPPEKSAMIEKVATEEKKAPEEKKATKEKTPAAERRNPGESEVMGGRPVREGTEIREGKSRTGMDTPERVLAATVPALPKNSSAPAKAAALSDEEMARAWPCFRGRGGSGISPYANIPEDWDGPSGKNILWKSPLPLPGNSSPVVVAGRIFVTGADEKQRQVYCYEAKSGKLLWQRDVPSTPESSKPIEAIKDDMKEAPGFAACTMVTDGRYVAAIFANGDLAAYDLDGTLAWSQSLGIPDNGYGHAASLAIYKDRLLVPMDQGTVKTARSKLRAFDIATGKQLWEQARAVQSSWSTPIVIRVDGRDEVVTSAAPLIIAYDPADGKELWRVKDKEFEGCDVAPSPVSVGNFVVVAGNDGTPVYAIRADGSGDVSASHVLWKAGDNTPDICSPLATEEFVFVMTSYGTLTCYDAKKGNKLWQINLGDMKCRSSPSLVGKQLYLFGEAGKCWIVEPARTGVMRVQQLDLGEGCITSPAFQEGRMYVRGKKNLFCIGQGQDN